MCGIVYARTKSKTSVLAPVNKLVLKQFRNQRHRGIQGFGVYDFDYKHIIKEPDEKKMTRWLRNHPSHEMMFHHRMPTSTGNVKNACHPFSTKDTFGDVEYVLIHNGVISNYKEMAKDHLEQGILYTSIQEDGRFNDSEVLLYDIALTMQGIQKEPKSRGSVAFIMLEKNKTDPKQNKLYWYHNSGHSTLFKRDNNKAFILSSEGGDGASPVEINQLFTYNYSDGSTSHEYLWVSNGFYNSPSNQPNQSSVPYRDLDDDPEARRAIADQVRMFANNEEDEQRERESAIIKQLEGDEAKQFELIEDSVSHANKLKAKVRETMTYCGGKYADAIYLLQGEIKDVSKKEYSLDNWYEMQQLGGALAIILADPFWDGKDPNTIHPVFTQNDSGDPENWDGSTVAPVSEPFSPRKNILEHTKTGSGTEHIATVISRMSDRGEELTSLFNRHTTPTAPDLVARIPVLP